MESEEANTPQTSELQVMLEGTCDPTRFLNLVKNFTVFDNDGSGKLIKKLPATTSSTPSKPPWRKPSGPQPSRERLP